MDFISLKPDESGTKDILLIADHFTKNAIAIATYNQKPSTYNSTKTEITGFANLSLVVTSTPLLRLHQDYAPEAIYPQRVVTSL